MKTREEVLQEIINFNDCMFLEQSFKLSRISKTRNLGFHIRTVFTRVKIGWLIMIGKYNHEGLIGTDFKSLCDALIFVAEILDAKDNEK